MQFDYAQWPTLRQLRRIFVTTDLFWKIAETGRKINGESVWNVWFLRETNTKRSIDVDHFRLLDRTTSEIEGVNHFRLLAAIQSKKNPPWYLASYETVKKIFFQLIFTTHLIQPYSKPYGCNILFDMIFLKFIKSRFIFL